MIRMVTAGDCEARRSEIWNIWSVIGFDPSDRTTRESDW